MQMSKAMHMKATKESLNEAFIGHQIMSKKTNFGRGPDKVINALADLKTHRKTASTNSLPGELEESLKLTTIPAV